MLRILVPGSLLVVISIVYFFGVAPDMTWMGLAGDAPDYVAASINFQRAGLGGYPLYITIGWVFETIFHKGLYFNPYWTLGLVSAISTVITCGFIYALVRLYGSETPYMKSGTKNGSIKEGTSKNRLPAILATLAYASSLLVWTQSVIPEVYTITVMFMVIGTYYLLRAYRHDRPNLLYVSAFIFGLSLCTHPLALFAVLPSLFYVFKVPLRNRPNIVKLLVIGLIGLLPWLQFLASSPENAYAGLSTGGLGWLLSSSGYIGGLPIFPADTLIVRLQDFGPMILLGLCVVVPFYILGFKHLLDVEPHPTILLGTIGLLPILLYVTSIPSQWITYILPSIAFLAIVGGLCAEEMLEESRFNLKPVVMVASICGLGLLGLNLYTYDIGRSIDPLPTTMRQAYTQLEELPSDAIVYTHTWGHIGVLLGAYNQDRDFRLTRIDSTKGEGYAAVRGTPPSTDKEVYADLADLRQENSDREIYVAYLKDRSKVQFDFIPLSDYRHSSNDVPQLNQVNGR